MQTLQDVSEKKQPVTKAYFTDDSALENGSRIRDLGIILDETITFGPHIDSCVKKLIGFSLRSSDPFRKSASGKHLM